jgi:hypothetical protein
MNVDRQTDRRNEANGHLSLFMVVCLQIGPMFRELKLRKID